MRTIDPQFSAAVEAHRAGRLSEAEAGYRRVLALVPDHGPSLHYLGLAAHQCGRHDEAISLITRAIAFDDCDPAMFNNRGEAFRALGQFDRAIADYQRCLALAPSDAAALNNLGIALRAKGDLPGARAALSRALQQQPGMARAHNNLGLVRQDLGDMDAAISSYRAALAAAPDFAEAAANLGVVLQKKGHVQEAEAAHRRAIAIDPTNSAFHFNLGLCLHENGRIPAAAVAFRAACTHDPESARAWSNLASCSILMGDLATAESQCRQALALDSEQAETHLHLAHILLHRRHFAGGWREYEWRWRCGDLAGLARPFTSPRWHGEPIAPSSALLVWGEQGLGDEILFAGLIGDLTARCPAIVWEGDQRLVPMLRRSYPAVRFVERQTPPAKDIAEAAIAAQISAGSLGGLLRPDIDSFPRRQNYLRADPARSASLRERITVGTRDRVIGISWLSRNPNAAIGRRKSVDLAAWADILATPGVRFVDLQYGDTAAERATLAATGPGKLIHLDDIDLTVDIDGVAAMIGACDLVLTVANAAAHLAGALGVPTWVLAPTAGKLWCWSTEDGTVPWYDTVRVFKHANADQLRDVLAMWSRSLANPPGPS